MKKILLLLCVCLGGGLFMRADGGNAKVMTPVDKEQGWIGSAEFDPLFIPCVKNSSVGFKLRLSATYKFHQYFSFGGAVALAENWKFSSAPSMDIVARLHAEDFRKDLSPFFDLDLGYMQSFENTDIRGFIFNPTVGIRYGRLALGLGYYGLVNGGISSNINIRLAYYFGYGKNKNSERVKSFFEHLDYSLAIGGIISGGNKSEKASHYMSPKGGVAFEAAALYPFENNLSIGLMLGFNYVDVTSYSKGGGKIWETGDGRSALIYAVRGRYDFRQVKLGPVHPYAKFDLGGASNFDTDAGSTSFYYSPGIGISLPLKNNTKALDLGISYAPVSIERPGGADEKAHDVASMRITLGYTF